MACLSAQMEMIDRSRPQGEPLLLTWRVVDMGSRLEEIRSATLPYHSQSHCRGDRRSCRAITDHRSDCFWSCRKWPAAARYPALVLAGRFYRRGVNAPSTKEKDVVHHDDPLSLRVLHLPYRRCLASRPHLYPTIFAHRSQ